MIKNFPPLGALRAFEAASRHGSFARAAEEIHVTPAAVSHQIKQLEHWLGMQLFERSARGVTLSAAGLEYAARTREAFDRLMMTSVAARANRTRRVVTIRSQHSIGALWVLPRILELHQQEPSIEIKLLTDGIDHNPAKGGADLSIYHHRPDIAGYQQQLLVQCTIGVYAAPSLLSRSGSITPAEILLRPLLHNAFEDRAWRYPTFEQWFRACGVVAPPILPGLRFALMHLTAQACARGAGFALLHDSMCDDDVRRGVLIRVSDVTIPTPHPYYVLSKRRVAQEVSFVRDWLLKRAEPYRSNGS
jgi:LysR family transcriptional regulator, glycine cleavage system transcriptional activator